MSQSIPLKSLEKAPAKKYKVAGGSIVLEKTADNNIILSAVGNEYKTVRIYESNNPNLLGTVEIQNNPEYSTRVNIRENSDIAVDPSRNNSAVLFKQPKNDFVGSYVVRPNMANYIKSNIAEWKKNLKVKIEPSVLDEFENQAKSYMEEHKVSVASFDCKIDNVSHRLTFKVAKSSDLVTTVNDIKSKRLNRTEPLSDKQLALLDKYESLVEAEKAGKVIGLSISLGDRELRHSFWNPKDELGGVEHTELQKHLKASKSTTTSDKKETGNAEVIEDIETIIG